MYWLENYDKYIGALQVFSTWWTGKHRREYNAIMRMLRSDDPDKREKALAKLEALQSEMPPKPPHLFNPTDITKLLNMVARLVDAVSKVESRHQVPLSAIPDMQRKMVRVVINVLVKRLGVDAAKVAIKEMADEWRLIQLEY